MSTRSTRVKESSREDNKTYIEKINSNLFDLVKAVSRAIKDHKLQLEWYRYFFRNGERVADGELSNIIFVTAQGYRKEEGGYNTKLLIKPCKKIPFELYRVDARGTPPVLLRLRSNTGIITYEYPPETFHAFLLYGLNPNIHNTVHSLVSSHLPKNELGRAEDFKLFISHKSLSAINKIDFEPPC